MLYLHVESDNASESIYYSSQTYKFEDIVEVGGLLYYIYLPYYLKNSTSFNSIFDRNLTYSEVDNCFIYSFDSNTTRVVVRNYLRNGKIYKITYKFDFTIDINLYYDEEERSVPDIYDIEGYNFNRMYVATFVLPNGREFKLGPLYEMNYSYVYDSLSSFIQKSNISGLYFDKDYKNQLILTSYETYQLEEDITIYIKLKLASKFNYTFKFPNEHNFEIIGNGEYYNGEKITLRIKNVSDELKALVYQTVYDRLRKESFTILDYSVDANGIRFSFYASARNYTIEFNIPTN